MKPMGIRPVHFPCKEDVAKRGEVNWWEYEVCTINKIRDKRQAIEEIQKELDDLDGNYRHWFEE